MKEQYLVIARCPIHKDFWSVCLDDADGGGTRFTPSKCCGLWEDIKKWRMDRSDLRDIIETCQMAVDELDAEAADG